MKQETKNKIQTFNDGLSAGSSIVSLAIPGFATIPLIVFVANRVIGLISDDDIIKRLKKVEDQLIKKKIDKDEFKNKILNLSDHKKFFASATLENIIRNCIPETVDIYISLFIDYIMNEKYDLEEELCEILSLLNKHDLELLINIKNYLKNGKRLNYKTELKNIEANKRQNELIEKENKEIDLGKSIKKLKKIPFMDRSIILNENRTVFWNDFSYFCHIPIQIPLYYTMLQDYCNLEHEEEYSSLIFYGKSFIKLEKCGLILLDYNVTLGTATNLNISRFHITLIGVALLKYI